MLSTGMAVITIRPGVILLGSRLGLLFFFAGYELDLNRIWGLPLDEETAVAPTYAAEA